MKFRVSSEAGRDILGISVYIARDNPTRAASFVEELYARTSIIAERPLSFPARPDLAPELRAGQHRPYLILFRIAGDTVEIARVIHGARDISQHL